MYQGQKPVQFCSHMRRSVQKRDSLPTNERINSAELVAAALETGGHLRVYDLDEIRNWLALVGGLFFVLVSPFSKPSARRSVERPMKIICGANDFNRNRSGFAPALVFSAAK